MLNLGFGGLDDNKNDILYEGCMKEIQSLLKIVSDGLKSVASGSEELAKRANDIAESQADEGPKAAAKPKAKKSAPAKPKKKPARKTAAKGPVKKAAKAPTAAEAVYDAISKSNEGVNTDTLMKETGYDRKKVANMVYKLGKQGKIKTVEKGVYMIA